MLLYGGEKDEAIRFMEEPPLDPPFSDAMVKWLAQVEEEQRQIESLSVVKRVYFTYGDSANDNKAWATLWCCWQPSGRSFKRVSVATHETLRPSLLEALKQLHANILNDHACDGHVHSVKNVILSNCW